MTKIVEHTKRLPRETPIDCRNWESFTFLTADYRRITLRVRELDQGETEGVESEANLHSNPPFD